MKKLFSYIAILCLLLLVTAGCGGQQTELEPTMTAEPELPTPTPEQEQPTQTASEIVEAMIASMNAGDVEESLSYFSDDAVVYIVGLPPTGMEVYAGKDQIRALWQDSVENHFQWETEITSVDGNIVNVLARTWHDFTRQLGVAPLEYYDVYEIKDGKITTYGTIITAEALARFMPAFEAVIPPEDPTPSTEEPVTEFVVTLSGGTCSIDLSAPLQAGEIMVTWNIEDENKDLYALTLFTLGEGKSFLDLMSATAGMPPSWAEIIFFDEAGPGQSQTYTFTVENGPIYLICWSQPPDLPIGNAGPIEVK